MLEWVAVLALAGATTFTESMAGQAWQGTRNTLARILGRGDAQREQRALERLDATAAEIEGASEADEPAVVAQATGRWETRLQDFLDEFPEARGELEELVSLARESLPEERAARVTQTLTHNKISGDANVIGTAGRDVIIGRKP